MLRLCLLASPNPLSLETKNVRREPISRFFPEKSQQRQNRNPNSNPNYAMSFQGLITNTCNMPSKRSENRMRKSRIFFLSSMARPDPKEAHRQKKKNKA